MNIQEQLAVDRILSSTKNKFGEYSYIYTFTNEDISGYLSYFDLNNKDILTVTGSGDHVLNLLLKVNKIDTFDINKFAYYFLILKKYAISSLEIDEYMCFLLNEKPDFDKKIFEKIKKNWEQEKDALNFFQYLFKRSECSYIKKTTLFVNNNIKDKEQLMNYNDYLLEQKYYELQKEILNKEINFYHSNITNLELNKKYDYLFLSNITDYLDNMFSSNSLVAYKKFLYKNIIPKLNKEGKIISYHYNGLTANYMPSFVRSVLNYQFTEKEVKEDKILIYEKRC